MQFETFKIGELASNDSEILEIIDVRQSADVVEYQVRTAAFQREMEPEEWHEQLQPTAKFLPASALKKFEHAKPRFQLAERVKLQDFDCVVRFIQYKNYDYYYSVMAIDHYGPTGGGWEKAESYLTK